MAMPKFRKIHYSTDNAPQPTCEMCGAVIDPGRTDEPYTKAMSIWDDPPFGFYSCTLDPPPEARLARHR